MSPLWIVDPSLQNAEEQGAAEIARRWDGPIRLFRPALVPGDGPTPASGYDCIGAVIMGSAASVHDERPWMGDLSAWLRPILDGRVRRPLLGICFGHQLIAHLAGAPVGWLEPDTRHKRVGVEATRLAAGPLGDAGATLRVVVSHREIVERAPDGYDTVGERPGVAVDALLHRTLPIVSYQFHPEARDEFAGRAGIDPAAIDAGVVADSRRTIDAFAALARGVSAGS